MPRLCFLIFFLSVWLTGCADSGPMSTDDFTNAYVAALKKLQPQLDIEVVGDLELKTVLPDGREIRMYLHNAYDEYKVDPSDREEVIQRYTAASQAMAEESNAPLDVANIIPIVKDRLWIEETNAAMLQSGAKKGAGYVSEPLNDDLVILYAANSPRSIQYLSPDELKMANVQREELRKLACENLARILPTPEYHWGSDVCMITADGYFESSLLLLDSVWKSEAISVEGDMVVAIPNRDVLLATGSKNPASLRRLKKMAAKAYAEGSYRLTTQLFVRRDGKFERFVEEDGL